jgi:hypothetical protein
MKRKLTILTQWYPPEQAPFGRMMQELASDLAARNWDVTVITGFPNHPRGEVFGGYRKRWLLEELNAGVGVQRVWLATSTKRCQSSPVSNAVNSCSTCRTCIQTRRSGWE